jgi:hypothetical protein
MMTPHFLRLAQIDDQHFVTACRHGLVHLTWGRTTIRFNQDELNRLAKVLKRALDDRPPTSIRDGELCATYRLHNDSELQVKSLVLLLLPAEFQELSRVVQESVRRLEEILTSGIWDKEDLQDAPSDLLKQLRRTPFSRN